MDSPQIQRDRNGPLGVVVGVDGSRIALDAVRWAVAEARLRGLPLRILHAASPAGCRPASSSSDEAAMS
jgi:nucleotide-binding universal stress UspA family protein